MTGKELPDKESPWTPKAVPLSPAEYKYAMGEKFYREDIHALLEMQKSYPSWSYEWTVFQEEIELDQLKWRQATRRKSLVAAWQYQNKHRRNPEEKPSV